MSTVWTLDTVNEEGRQGIKKCLLRGFFGECVGQSKIGNKENHGFDYVTHSLNVNLDYEFFLT